MNKKLRRVIAIISLVFFAIFTVSLICWLANRTLLNGQIGFLTLFSGGIGFALFLTIKLSKDYSEESNDTKQDNEADKKDTNVEQPSDEENDNK